MKKRELINLGLAPGRQLDAARRAVDAALQAGMERPAIRRALRQLIAQPGAYREHPQFGTLADVLAGTIQRSERSAPVDYRQWGTDIDPNAIQQMENACRLPVSVQGALMPDAHLGYGLPIGGVLAVDRAVIPYAVGVDIACRMKMTVLDLPPDTLETGEDRLTQALHAETRFGIGSSFKQRREHPVLDEDWSVSQVTREKKDKAWSQLGTSGSGNHFVEFGILTLDWKELGLEKGRYLALLSHSGSRGTGAKVASEYSKLAMALHPELPKPMHHLAWLDLDTEPGQEYWGAMELMGRYAAANHELIHRHVARHLGAEVLLDLENHHNFAWRETHDGKEVIVHRKGATPAGRGVVGIIPGSMATPAFIVRGQGGEGSLDSAAHGAGRRMSRTAARKQFAWKDVQPYLQERGVKLISAGLDEVPMAYKDILQVMAAQEDLVEPIARFDPRLVKMAPAGERPED